MRNRTGLSSAETASFDGARRLGDGRGPATAESASRLAGVGMAALVAALSAGCALMVVFRPYLTGSHLYFLFLIWNLFLAWLPYAATAGALLCLGALSPSPVRTALVAAFGALWLLFLPNAAYLATDFIHLVANQDHYVNEGIFGYMLWYDLVMLFLFSWCGVFLGFLSTYPFHRLIAERAGGAAGWAFVAVVSALCGYGIFLGRIVRLNSWDALVRPGVLIDEIMGNLHVRGALFSLLFAAFTAITYVFLYALRKNGRTRPR